MSMADVVYRAVEPLALDDSYALRAKQLLEPLPEHWHKDVIERLETRRHSAAKTVLRDIGQHLDCSCAMRDVVEAIFGNLFAECFEQIEAYRMHPSNWGGN